MDKIAKVKNELQLRNWTDMELGRQRSGMTIAEWCEHEQISKSAYYYRLRKVREKLCEQVAVPVADIPVCSAAALPSCPSAERNFKKGENNSSPFSAFFV